MFLDEQDNALQQATPGQPPPGEQGGRAPQGIRRTLMKRILHAQDERHQTVPAALRGRCERGKNEIYISVLDLGGSGSRIPSMKGCLVLVFGWLVGE